MAPRTTIILGSLTLHVGQLKLGQLKKVRNELQTLLAMRDAPAAIPTVEQLDAMVAVLHASASAADPEITRDRIAGAVDDLPYDVAIKELSDGIADVMTTSGLATPRAGAVSTGEAASPAS